MCVLVKVAGIRAVCSVETVADPMQKLCILGVIGADIFFEDTVAVNKAKTDSVHSR